MLADIRVLIVDDEVHVAELLTEIVESFGYTAHMVTNGTQALRAVREFRPKVVLLDVRMPDIGGETVLERFRTSTPSPAVIIVTGDTDYEQAKALLARGAFDYVTKPVDLEYLRQAIETAAATASGELGA
jgi:two-component system, OmpR family, response regulator